MATAALKSPLKIGILALQGCVEPHKKHLEAAGAQVVEVRHSQDFIGLQGLIIPGGESTTLLKLIHLFDLKKDLDQCATKIPIWGICAGAILMASSVNSPRQESFSYLDVAVDRNAYGRQLQSFESEIFNSPVAFIRAPVFAQVGPKASVLAEEGGHPVWISQGKHMVTSFHPELGNPQPSHIHQYFLDRCASF